MDILAMDAPATTVRTVAVELQSLTRRFVKLAAGNRINLSISAGAISGLPGTNGSGQAGFHNTDQTTVAYQQHGARNLHRHRIPALFRGGGGGRGAGAGGGGGGAAARGL